MAVIFELRKAYCAKCEGTATKCRISRGNYSPMIASRGWAFLFWWVRGPRLSMWLLPVDSDEMRGRNDIFRRAARLTTGDVDVLALFGGKLDRTGEEQELGRGGAEFRLM